MSGTTLEFKRRRLQNPHNYDSRQPHQVLTLYSDLGLFLLSLDILDTSVLNGSFDVRLTLPYHQIEQRTLKYYPIFFAHSSIRRLAGCD